MREPAPPIPTIAELDLPRLDVSHIKVWCDKCHHQAKVALGDIDGNLTILEFAGRLRCSACGAKACSAMPAWPNGGGGYIGGAHRH